MKKLILMSLFIAFQAGYAQYNSGAPWMKNSEKNRAAKGVTKTAETPMKFQEIVDNFNEYWKDKDRTQRSAGYNPFKRWERRWKNALNPDGSFTTTEQLLKSWEYKKSRKGLAADQSNWTPKGMTDYLDREREVGNRGRVNVVQVDPNNENIYYLGTPAGGLWKSTNAGKSWTPLTDEFPQLGVSSIAIDPTNSNILYIGTGDDDHNTTRTLGIFKSTDGGLSWKITGFNAGNTEIYEIYIDPSDRNTIFTATGKGFYKSVNGGTSFYKTLDVANLEDMNLKPGNSNIIYAVSRDRFYKSTNKGESFSVITNGLPNSSDRIKIDVTPAAPNNVYLLSSINQGTYNGLYRSSNSGQSFTKTANTKDIFFSSQMFYNMGLAVSDTNPNEIYTGAFKVAKSSDGGDSFQVLTTIDNSRPPFYSGVDIHFLRFFNGKLFCGSDGGVFRSSNSAKTFDDLTNNMQITQFYDISVSQQNPDKIIGGLQDCGTMLRTNSGPWTTVNGGDGQDNVFNPTNDNISYSLSFFPQLTISENNGQKVTHLDSKGARGNPIAFSNDELFVATGAAGGGALHVFRNGALIKVSQNFPGEISELTVDPSNQNIMYIRTFVERREIKRSTDRGKTFNSLNSFRNDIVSIAAHSTNSNILYVVTEGSKVMRSLNGGQTFEDITGSLSNSTELKVIRHQGNHPNNPIFVGTDVGVFRKDDTMSDWEPFDNNLPNAPVTDIVINSKQSIITVATFGRGVWQSPTGGSGSGTTNIPVTGVTLSQTNITIDSGNTTDILKPTIRPANASNKAVTWSSNNTNVATVNSNGLISAKTAGKAIITVKTVDGNKTDNATITVNGTTAPPPPTTGGNSLIIEAENLVATGGTFNDGQVPLGMNISGVGVNFVNAGDYAEYTISVAAGTYAITYQISTPMDNAEITFKADGNIVSRDAVINNGQWDSYQALRAGSNVTLSAGTHTIRIEASGSNQWQWNLDKIELTAVGSTTAPAPVPATTPTPAPPASGATLVIQAEDFSNTGGPFDGFQTYTTGGVTATNFNQTGDWAEYSVSIPQSGAYSVEYFISTPFNGPAIEFIVDGVSQMKDNVANNGSWDGFTSMKASRSVTLTAGTHVIRLLGAGTNGWEWNLDRFVLTSTVANRSADVLELSKLSVSPNPSSTFLEINGLPKGKSYVTIFNLTGVRISNAVPIDTDNNSISTNELQSGIYFLEIKANNGATEAIQFIKISK